MAAQPQAVGPIKKMHLTAGFGSELIGDLCYPPLQVGQMVNLSFQVEISSRIDRTAEPLDFQVAPDAECVFIADVLPLTITVCPKSGGGTAVESVHHRDRGSKTSGRHRDGFSAVRRREC